MLNWFVHVTPTNLSLLGSEQGEATEESWKWQATKTAGHEGGKEVEPNGMHSLVKNLTHDPLSLSHRPFLTITRPQTSLDPNQGVAIAVLTTSEFHSHAHVLRPGDRRGPFPRWGRRPWEFNATSRTRNDRKKTSDCSRNSWSPLRLKNARIQFSFSSCSKNRLRS